MPIIGDRLKQVTLKVEGAKKHVSDLDDGIKAFVKMNPYKVVAEHDPNTRKLVYYVASADPTPDCLPLLAGDAIQNLMSALDHLAYQIVCNDTGDQPPNPSRIYFPIADSAEKYEAKKQGKMQGARQETFEAIDALKPYKGGNDPLWMLYRLNNIEKHRLLITVGSMLHSLDLGAHASKMMADTIAALPPDHPLQGKKFPIMSAFFGPGPNVRFPLKAGDILFIDAPDAEPNEKLQFRFDVALYEPEVIKAQSLLKTVHEFTTLVERIVSTLTPRLQ
jgi:hypothetical protein